RIYKSLLEGGGDGPGAWRGVCIGFSGGDGGNRNARAGGGEMSELFDVGKTSLDSGSTLIEASAGTGKTYTLAGMVVRLVAERGLALGQILVVTFTEAATPELRERVRSRIRDAVVFLEEGRPGKDPA